MIRDALQTTLEILLMLSPVIVTVAAYEYMGSGHAHYLEIRYIPETGETEYSSMLTGHTKRERRNSRVRI